MEERAAADIIKIRRNPWDVSSIQQALVDDAGNIDLQEEERLARHQLVHLSKAEESMYKQRSRDLLVNLGDGNTKYFYNLMRASHANSFISQITDKEGNIFADHEGISTVFVSHFSNILALATEVQYPNLSHIVPHGYVTEEDANSLTRQVTISDIE